MSSPYPTLPIDAAVPDILRTLTEAPVTILTAAPGAGKTTRVPLVLLQHALAAQRQILMLEPRRLAAQRAAGYMASLLDEEPGKTIGYRIRGTTVVSGSTRVEVLTEGILTRMLQDMPDLPRIGILIFDEFHERSIHADIGLALALDVQAHLRPDLRILIMSATLDGAGVHRVLPDAPRIDIPGRQYPVETVYSAFTPEGPLEKTVSRSVVRALAETEGDILVFLPGRRELRRTREMLLDTKLPPDVHVHLLHGDADPAAQRAALAVPRPGERKVILATSVAETSVTIDGVRVVIDAGLARVPRFDPRRGMSGLETVPVSVATADQRRGRAGRQAAGVCYRLWTEADHRKLQPQPVPEILSADLAPLALDLARWGSPDAAGLRMIDAPPPHHLTQAQDLLQSLGALDSDGRPTPHGRAMADLPLHPRLSHMVLRALDFDLGSDACNVAALLDGPYLSSGVDIDLTTIIHALQDQHTVEREARLHIRSEAARLRRLLGIPDAPAIDQSHGLLLALAYPDRIARRRSESSNRYLLANGTGVILPGWSLLSRSEFLAVGEVDNAGVDAKILLAAPLGIGDIRRMAEHQMETLDEIRWDSRAGAVVARRVLRLGAIVLEEQPSSPDGEGVVRAMIDGIRNLGLDALPWNPASVSLRSRSEWVRINGLVKDGWPDLSAAALESSIAHWLGPFLSGMTRKEHLSTLDLHRILSSLFSHPQRVLLERLAPASLSTPSGRRVVLLYGNERQPVMRARLQEMFGQTESPTVGAGSIPVVMHLLSPAGRPLAVTSDLRSFWANAYTDVRKQMRGRYPKHRWPEDPLRATP